MKLLKAFLWFTFMLYIAFLGKVILIKHLPISYIVQHLEFGLNFNQINFVPFATIADYFASKNTVISIENIIGNVLIFMPLGLLLPVLIGKFRNNILALILASFIFSLLFEASQLLFPLLGSFDVDDLLLNTVGALLGYFGFTLIKKVVQKRISHDKRELV